MSKEMITTFIVGVFGIRINEDYDNIIKDLTELCDKHNLRLSSTKVIRDDMALLTKELEEIGG